MQQAVDDFETLKGLWPQVKALSYLELKVLSDAINGEMQEKVDDVRAELRGRMATITEPYGLSVADVVGTQKRRGKRCPAATTRNAEPYRNPDNPEETWSGKGRKPNWMRRRSNDGAPSTRFANQDAPAKE